MFPPLTDDDHAGQRDRRSRRRFLLGVGATVAVAGCIDDSGDTTTDVDTDQETEKSTTTGLDGQSATTDPDDRDQSSEESLSRAEARRLLPQESLAFRYVPPLGNSLAECWVAVVGETDAAAVRAEAESGGYNEVEPRDGTIDGYLGVPVQVDPDGDEVAVFAVDDDGARGRVTSVSVPTDDLTTGDAEQAVSTEDLAFTYEPPDAGDYGHLTVELTADTDADTLVAHPLNGPAVFEDRVGNFGDEDGLEAGTTLGVAVEPSGDEVLIWATVGDATGEVTRWRGPD
jgi:hypothetical protein